jgi:5,10-methylene-tetrahydrofolate dehydrogenase/methenyl tetrahydrofolate cyclohydrolase
MQLLDGKACALAYKAQIAKSVQNYVSAGVRKPHLAAILVGNDGASETYIASKVKTCALKILGLFVLIAIVNYPLLAAEIKEF